MSPWSPIKAYALWALGGNSGCCGSLYDSLYRVCVHITSSKEILSNLTFLILYVCVCVCSSAQALILDVCMLVSAGLTTGADDCVPLYSLLFIYNLSTANTFRPMGALWIHLHIIKKCVELCKRQLHKFDHALMIRWGRSKQMAYGLMKCHHKA